MAVATGVRGKAGPHPGEGPAGWTSWCMHECVGGYAGEHPFNSSTKEARLGAKLPGAKINSNQAPAAAETAMAGADLNMVDMLRRPTSRSHQVKMNRKLDE